MSTVSAPFGLRPIHHPSGQVRLRQYGGIITSGYAYDIYQHMPVKWATDGTIARLGATTDDLCGVFAGCTYIPPGGLRPVYSNFWPANATYVTGTLQVWLCEEPDTVYEVQGDGAVAQTAIGDEANFVNYTSGDSVTGNSTAGISASLVGAGSQGQVRILNKSLNIDNDWGDAYTVVQVEIARHQRRYNKVAI